MRAGCINAAEAGFVRRVREARDRMPPGAWLAGGRIVHEALDARAE